MFRTTAFFAALVATAATVSFPAQAADAVSHSAQVRYADINLASADGAKMLKERVARAARSVCSVSGDKSLADLSAAQDCTKTALAKAMPQVELALANAGTQVADNGHITVAAH